MGYWSIVNIVGVPQQFFAIPLYSNSPSLSAGEKHWIFFTKAYKEAFVFGLSIIAVRKNTNIFFDFLPSVPVLFRERDKDSKYFGYQNIQQHIEPYLVYFGKRLNFSFSLLDRRN